MVTGVMDAKTALSSGPHADPAIRPRLMDMIELDWRIGVLTKDLQSE